MRGSGDLDSYVLTDAYSKLAADTKHAKSRMARWMRSKDEWRGRTGWLLCAHLARREGALSNDEASALLADAEARIHASENRVRDAMNSAVIAIGMRGGRLEREAVAAAKRIGKVDVDHGETGCKTPDAVQYIVRAKERATRKK